MISLWHDGHFRLVVTLVLNVQLIHISDDRRNYNRLLSFRTRLGSLGQSAILLVTLYLNLPLVSLFLIIVGWSIDAAA